MEASLKLHYGWICLSAVYHYVHAALTSRKTALLLLQDGGYILPAHEPRLLDTFWECLKPSSFYCSMSATTSQSQPMARALTFTLHITCAFWTMLVLLFDASYWTLSSEDITCTSHLITPSEQYRLSIGAKPGVLIGLHSVQSRYLRAQSDAHTWKDPFGGRL